MYISLGLAVPLLGFILFTITSHGLRGAAEYFAILIGGLLGAAFRLALALALFASPIMAFICMMRAYCYSENVIQLGTTRKPYSVGRALVFGMLSGSAALGALCGFKNPGKNKMICRSCHREFTVKPK